MAAWGRPVPERCERFVRVLLLAAVAVALAHLGCDDTKSPDPSNGGPTATPVVADSAAPSPGRWRAYRTHQYDAALTEEQREEIKRLEALGYLSGVFEAPAESGVLRHSPDRVRPGLNLYTSGHRAQAILMDMEGNVLHRWQHDFAAIWPDYPVSQKIKNGAFWRRVHLFENGDLLAIFEGLGLIKLDRDSNLIWANSLRAHHDFDVTEDGRIHVLTREARLEPDVDPQRPISVDFITTLDAQGNELSHLSLLSALDDSNYAQIFRSRDRKHGDIFHTNSLSLLGPPPPGAPPEFAEGHFLVSMLWLDAIAVVDPAKNRVVWAHQGSFRTQHDPNLLPNGNLLLFDNRGTKPHSRVLELEPRSGEIVWRYQGSDAEPFYSETCGTAQRLENGNTLITESDRGRAIEVDAEGEVVWEFLSPFRAGEDGELIATVMEMVRLPADFARSWLAEAGD